MSASLIIRYPEGKSLGVTSGVASTELVVSVSEDGAQLYDAASKKLLRRFPLGGNNVDLVTAVVGDPDTGSYFAALRDPLRGIDYLVSWEASADNVPLLSDISPRIPVDGKVDALHVLHTADGSSAVVVLSDGSVAVPRWNDFTLQFLSTKSAKTACILTQSSHDKLAVVSQQEGSDVLLQLFTYSQQGVTRTASFHPSGPRNSSIIAMSMSRGMVACLWSCGTLHMHSSSSSSSNRLSSTATSYQLNSSLLPATASTSQTVHGSTRKRKAAADTPATSSLGVGFSMVAIDDSRLLFATYEEGDQLTTALFDARYGCVVNSNTITLTPPPTNPAATLQLQQVAETFLLSVGGCTYTLDLDVPSSDLAHLVGKLGAHAANRFAGLLSAAEQSQRCLPQALVLQRMDLSRYVLPQAAETVTLDSNALVLKAIEHRDEDTPDIRQHTEGGGAKSQSAVGGSARQYAELSKQAAVLLAALLEHQHRHQHSGGASRGEHPDNSQASTQNTVGTTSSSSNMTQLLDDACSLLTQCHKQKVLITSQLPQIVCLQLAAAGRWQQLNSVLQSYPLQSLHDCPSLLQLLSDARQHRLVAVVCQMVQDVPVSSVADVLSQALTPTDDADAAAARQQYKERVQSAAEASVRAAEGRPADPSRLVCARVAAAAVDGFSAEEIILHSLISVPLDPMALLAAARQLRGRQVHALLRYLAKWVKKYSKHLGPGPLPKGLPPVLAIPTFAQVLEWVKAVLDGHLAMLILHKGLKPVLQSLKDVVGVQLSQAEKLSRMRGIAEHMKASSALPAASMAAAASYTVELLDLRVVKQQV